jgi:hypothetical protein
MRNRIFCALALALLAGCGSDSDENASEDASPSATESAQAGARSARTAPAADDLWAPIAPPEAPLPARDPRAPLDPDATLARYASECADDASRSECRALRRDLELVFFADLLGLRRGGQPLERALVRAAARAELPQLACFGLRELLMGSELTQDDAALIRSALDSPWRAPREVVRTFGYRATNPVPGLADLFERDANAQRTGSPELCLDGGRDAEPNPALVGNYPGAQHRPFASSEDLRWFTTPDPPERVLAQFAKRGMRASTAEELKAEQQARYLAEITQLTSGEPTPDSPDTTRQMMEMIFEASRDWGRPFAQLERIGEIRFVTLAPQHVVAVFRDDALGATALVASRPAVFDAKAMGL